MRPKFFILVLVTGIVLLSGFTLNYKINHGQNIVIVEEDYDTLWAKAESLANKGMPKSALEVVDKIYQKARAENNSPHFIKANLYKLKLKSSFEEDYLVKMINHLENEVKTAEAPAKQILHSIIAQVYWGYYQANRHRFLDRSITVGLDEEDIATWDLSKIMSKITRHYSLSLEQPGLLKDVQLNEFSLILEEKEGSKQFRPTLFDFLAHRALEYYINDESSLTRPAHRFELDKEKYLSDYKEFAVTKISPKDTLSLKYHALLILQDLISFHMDDEDPQALIDVEMKRLAFVRENAVIPGKDSIYYERLVNLRNSFSDHPSSSEVIHKMAQFLFERGQQYNPLESEKYKWDIKKAHGLTGEAMEKFPKADGTVNCMILREQIENKSLKLTTHYANIPGKPFLGLISYKNISKVYFRLTEINYEKDRQLNENNRREALISQYLRIPPAKEWEYGLVDDGDFQNHSAEMKISELTPGYYVLLIGSDKDFSYGEDVVAHSAFWITNLSYISQREKNGQVDVYVLDRDSGHPLKDVEIKSYYQEYDYDSRKYVFRQGDTYYSNDEGYFNIPTASGQSRRLMLEFIHKNDRLVTPNYFYQQRFTEPDIKERTKTFFFTDRSIYRPGQTIYFKGIVLDHRDENYEIKPDHKTSVSFLNVNSQKVADMELVTNEYGSFHGSFIAPIGGITGNMIIRDENGSTTISIEEYKRPKFEVVFEPVKGSYKLNESVTVKGNAKTYAGSNVDQASVKYRIVRQHRFPIWRDWWIPVYPVTGDVEIANGITSTDEDGNFSIEFNAIPDLTIEKKYDPIFSFKVFVDVTDINGETRSAQTVINIGYKALLVDVTIPEHLSRQGREKYYLKTTNLNGEFEPSRGTMAIYRLKQPERLLRERSWQRPDIHIIDKDGFYKDFPNDIYKNEGDRSTWETEAIIMEKPFNTESDSVINMEGLENWETGVYKIKIITEDAFGKEVKFDKYFTLFDENSDDPPVHSPDWFTILKDEGEPGDEASFLLGTSAKKVRVIYELSKDNKVIEKEILDLNNEQKKISVKIEESHRGNVGLCLTFVHLNRSYQHNSIIKVPYTNKKLDIEFSTFRDKLKPGQEEEWQIRIRDKKGDVVAAEMLASMYDASLDAFKDHGWSFDLYGSYNRVLSWNIRDAFLTKTSQSFKQYHGPQITPEYREYDQLNWFGFRFRGFYPLMDKGLRSTKATPGIETAEPTIQSFDGDKGMPAEEEATTGEPPIPSLETPAEDEFSGLQVRRDFRETAFFMPELRTDGEGNIIMSFTMPEALTRWKFMGLAYSKDLKSGLVEKELVTQKDLMVMPNPPRFFRQGDKMDFSAKIVNLSDRTLEGTVSLQFFDAITMQPVNILDDETSREKTFAVSKGNSKAASWSISLPDDLSAITYRIIAKARNFSDGEEMAIPVMTNRMMVTETLPLPVSGKTTKSFRFKKLINQSSKTMKNYRYTLEFTSNPAWYAVQALPYLMEYPHESSDQVFSRYYANSIATYISNSNPKIRRVFESWKELTPDALLSNLEKNQDLKSVILEETPWVMQAKSESERKQRIGLLFDLNHMAANLQGSLQKLIKKQSPNGGWPWFEGMRDNRYITQHIVTGFGHLDHLGITDIREDNVTWRMITKAVLYLDDRIQEDYEYLKENYPEKMDEPHLGYIQIQYLYARSYFMEDIKLSNRYSEAFDYYKEQAKKYWLRHNHYMQGMIALALNRLDVETIPSDIMASIKEHALYNEEMGMYWRSENGYFWYQAPVETQALLIEAFDEVVNDMESVEKMKIWLLKQKQTQDWETSKATTEACYALLLRGTDLLASDQLVEITIGDKEIDPRELDDTKVEAGTGYFRTSWSGGDITPDMGNIKVSKKDEGVAWGAVYWQYFEDLDKITTHETPLSLKKQLFVEENTPSGPVIREIREGGNIKVGDKVIVRMEIRVDRDMEYVHLKDMRAAGFEPVNVLSGYRYKGGLGYYESTRDASTNFFIGYLRKGTYVFEYPLIASQSGNFSNGITTIQCMYAPEFASHSEGIRVNILP